MCQGNVLPGKVQGLGTIIQTRLQKLHTAATIQPTGYASLMMVSYGNNCAILKLLWVFCYFQTLYGFQHQKCFTKQIKKLQQVACMLSVKRNQTVLLRN